MPSELAQGIWWCGTPTRVRWAPVAMLVAAVLLTREGYATGDGPTNGSDTVALGSPPVAETQESADSWPVSVITAEEIRRSGAGNLAEVLRMVAGIDIAAIDSRRFYTAIRGMAGDQPGVLVMVDGREVNSIVWGEPQWELLSIPIQAVDRIEIVRSPASSRYGSGACNGAINIVTAGADDRRGLEVSLTGGEYSTLVGSGFLGLTGGQMALCVAAELDETDGWPGREENPGRILRGMGVLRYRYSDEGGIKLVFGRTQAQQVVFPSHPVSGTVAGEGSITEAALDATYREWLGRVTLRHENFTGPWHYSDRPQTWVASRMNLTLGHTASLGKCNTLRWGMDYVALSHAPNDLIPSFHARHQVGAYASDRIRLTDHWWGDFGLRYDYRIEAAGTLSAHAGLVFDPRPHHRLHLLLSRGDALASVADERLSFSVWDSGAPSATINVRGLSSGKTRLTTYGMEAGYRGDPARYLTVGVTPYYRYYPKPLMWAAESVGISGSNMMQVEQRLRNAGEAYATGGELELEYRPAEWCEVHGNYAIRGMWGRGADAVRWRVPRQSCNLGVVVSMAGFRAALWTRWSENSSWRIHDLRDNGVNEKLEVPLVVSLRIGYAVKNAEISTSVFNLFDRTYREYPAGAGGNVLRQKVSVQLTCRF